MRYLSILILIVLLAACSSSDDDKKSDPTSTPNPPTPTSEPQTLCERYPNYCVSFSSEAPVAGVETAGLRSDIIPGQAAPDVVRGMRSEGFPFLGDPNAPVEIVEIRDFGCSHCRDYHLTELPRIFEDFVLTGEIQFAVATVVIGGSGGPNHTAALAAFCAGEQGAYWEMSDVLYHGADEMGGAAYTVDAITAAANGIGLDGTALAECVSSARYQSLIDQDTTFATDNGASFVPAVYYRYRGQESWTFIERDYETIRAVVEAAP
jgi:protein-disulfide isomerase